MNKLIIIIAIVFSGMLLQAQSNKYGTLQEKYEHKYINAMALKKTGIYMFSIGTGVAIGGIIMGVTGDLNYNNSLEEAGQQFFYMGFAAMNIGAPLWISGSIVAKNNRKALERLERDISLSFAITNTGPGLILKF